MSGLNAAVFEMGRIKRIWEIDFLRGVAIIMMIVSNLFTDLSYFGIYNIDMQSGFWWFFARIVVSMFIFLVGVSLILSYSRIKGVKTPKEIRIKYLKRGLKIFGWGLIITAVTLVFLREDFILFGVLHFIGTSIILVHFLLRYRFLNLILGIFFIFIGIYLGSLTFDFYWLLWLGFQPSGFYSVDYVPIFPWLGVVLFGIFFGNLFYPDGKRRFKIADLSNYSFINIFCFLGRYSLVIYLIHQPILIIILWLFFPFPYGFPF